MFKKYQSGLKKPRVNGHLVLRQMTPLRSTAEFRVSPIPLALGNATVRKPKTGVRLRARNVRLNNEDNNCYLYTVNRPPGADFCVTVFSIFFPPRPPVRLSKRRRRSPTRLTCGRINCRGGGAASHTSTTRVPRDGAITHVSSAV